MVAHSKNHKVDRNLHRPHKPLGRQVRPAPEPPAEPEEPKDEDLSKDDEEPKPEDLAKEEEALKAEEAAATETGPEEPVEPRTRERSSYDGDTAIKLYLRE